MPANLSYAVLISLVVIKGWEYMFYLYKKIVIGYIFTIFEKHFKRTFNVVNYKECTGYLHWTATGRIEELKNIQNCS